MDDFDGERKLELYEASYRKKSFGRRAVAVDRELKLEGVVGTQELVEAMEAWKVKGGTEHRGLDMTKRRLLLNRYWP